MTVGLLTALKNNCDEKEAFDIAVQGFANYMTSYYENILAGTSEGSQERFDAFREHYEQYAGKSCYLDIVESRSDLLKVCYRRCPFSEVLDAYGISEFSRAFCLSDYAFTKKVLPGVTFHRTREIAKGDNCCDHTWVFRKGESGAG